MEKQKQKQEWLLKNVNPILERLCSELYEQQPQQIAKFMIEWLQKNGDLQESNEEAQQEQEKSFEDDEEIDEVELLDKNQLIHQNKAKTSRISVSAEVFGEFNRKKEFKPVVYQKEQSKIQSIAEILDQSILFNNLAPQDKQIVIDAMKDQEFKKGSQIIKQGEEGSVLFVVSSGTIDCFRVEAGSQDSKKVREYVTGEVFGELALLYNVKRQATLIAQTDCLLYSLDRETFNHIVKESAIKKRERYQEFLKQVDILNDMTDYERDQVADVLQELEFQNGESIISEDEIGEHFYILEEGTCEARKQLQPNQAQSVVADYKVGDYFGEIALLKECKRQANIVTTSQVKVVRIDKKSFQRVMGPLDDILRRNFSKYEKYIS